MPRFAWLGFSVLFLICVAPPNTSNAQQTKGSLEARVVDHQGQPVEGAQVVIEGPALQGSRTSTTNSEGQLRIPALPVGSYELTISHGDHQDVIYQDVVVYLGKTTTLGKVRLAAVEQVVVYGGRVVIDPVSTELGANLSGEELALLPNDRDFLSMVAYLPQANASFFGDATNMAGGTGTENAYVIDGANVSDPYLGESNVRLPLNFVREIEVKTGGYQAEYGRASGGVINVITHTGSNQHRGEVFAFFTNNNFAADRNRGLVQLESADFTRYDIGLSVGGPVLRDKLWYFVAYDPRFEREELEIPGAGFHEDKRTIHQFAGKLTWKAAETTRFDLSVFGDPTRHDQVGRNDTSLLPDSLGNPDPFLGKLEAGGYTIALRGEWATSTNSLLQGSVSYFDRQLKLTPATERGWTEALFQDPERGFEEGGYGEHSNVQSSRTSGRLVGSVFFPRHDVKLGFEYEDNRVDNRTFNERRNGDPGLLLRLNDSLFVATRIGLDSEAGRVRVPSVFLQDSWTIHDRVRLNLGVRWDGLYFVRGNGAVANQITNQVQPRAGFVIQPGALGTQKISGSYGRYFVQPPQFAAGAFLGNAFQTSIEFDGDPRVPGGYTSADTMQVFDKSFLVVDGDLRGMHYDEFTLGYERQVGAQWRLGARGIWRELGEAIEDAFAEDFSVFVWGNPGRGQLSHLPSLTRRYTALELSFEKHMGTIRGAGSYVLSRNSGKYPGSFINEGITFPHASSNFDILDQFTNLDGVLPNDRTHVLKLYAKYASDFGFTAGGFFTWQHGTPLSELGGVSGGGPCPSTCMHLRERGTLGRTPNIWDLNLRFTYDLATAINATRVRPRLVLDVLHLFGQKEAAAFDQVHFVTHSATENVNFLQPFIHQPPMTLRLGLEMGF